MTTLTVYFCGTSSSKFDDANANYWNGELISTLAKNDLGREFANWIVIDGPGSGNQQDDELFTKPGGYYKWNGTLFGAGWEENVKHATHIMKGKFDWQRETLTQENYQQLQNAGIPINDVTTEGCWLWRKYNYGNRHVTQQQLQEQIIKTFRKDGIIPTQVNFVGWSRGGISCHMLANAMLNDSELSGIPVNILAIDPVPGLLYSSDKKVEIGSNVKEYVAFYARDERSRGFDCVVPKTFAHTKTSIYPIAGRHATLVGNASANGAHGAKELQEPGEIIRHYAEVCLSRWGVSLQKKLNLTIEELDEKLTKIKNDFGKYTTMRSTTYPTGSTETSGERTISSGSDTTHFTAMSGTRFTPQKGLSVGHILTNEYFSDIAY
ncbi:hypothetical protein [Pseudomonas fluorescens]|uniref:hypothetical protein n=1 Tax=Pseudomonas fluorescens TaxID=294 RepID=UPI003D08346E